MPEFTPSTDEARFLSQHKINPDDVFNARGLRSSEWKSECRRLGKRLAYTPDSPCKNSGHMLRDLHNHCVQCRPENLVFSDRHHASAWIYIAWSEALSLFKIGISSNTGNRRRQTKEGYGGATDWMVVYRRQFNGAGKIEAQVHASLRAFQETRRYTHRGKQVHSKELFRCDYRTAVSEVESHAQYAIGPAEDVGKILTRWKNDERSISP